MIISSKLRALQLAIMVSYFFGRIEAQEQINQAQFQTIFEEGTKLAAADPTISSSQKTIGVIGGVSWESTVLYYQLINQAVREELGGLSSAKLLIYSLDYEPIVALERQDKWDEVAKIVSNAALTLQNGGADFLILCCNTLHKVTPSIEGAITIPFLHIADAVGETISSQKIKKVGLLGTQFTMEDGFYGSRLQEKFGLEVVIPDSMDRKMIDDIIYNELCLGKVDPQSRKEVIRMMQALQNEGAEAILLGCTELGMLVQESDAEVPVYDTTLQHAHEAVRNSLSQVR